jgi:hypothetical protein
LVDGATGSLTITGSSLPDGMSVGSTTDNGDDTFTATVTYDLTTEQDVTTTFSATGGSVAATPLVHEFDVQAEASGGPVLVQQAASGPGGNSASYTATLPATATAGNTLLFAWRAKDSSSTPTTFPAGMSQSNQVAVTDLDGSDRVIRWYTKVADGTEQALTFATSISDSGGVTVQEFEGAITTGTTTGANLGNLPGTTAACGPTDAPPSASAIPAMFLFRYHPSTNGITWPTGWTGTTGHISNAYNVARCGVMDTAPNAAVTANVTFEDTGEANDYMYWASLWVDKA